MRVTALDRRRDEVDEGVGAGLGAAEAHRRDGAEVLRARREVEPDGIALDASGCWRERQPRRGSGSCRARG